VKLFFPVRLKCYRDVCNSNYFLLLRRYVTTVKGMAHENHITDKDSANELLLLPEEIQSLRSVEVEAASTPK
jgi:hypothetical protein